MKILCTGNPSKQGVAHEVKKKWADSRFASRSNGFDFTQWTDQSTNQFDRMLIESQIFINLIFVAPGIQENLLDRACKIWTENDIKGHVITIGTTLEWSPDHSETDYIRSKLQLRGKSLKMNDMTGITGVKSTYMIVGGIYDGKKESMDHVLPVEILLACEWAWNNQNRIGLLQIDSRK
jgi:hypothetical protein